MVFWEIFRNVENAKWNFFFSCVDITQWERCIYYSVGVEVIFLETNIVFWNQSTLSSDAMRKERWNLEVAVLPLIFMNFILNMMCLVHCEVWGSQIW